MEIFALVGKIALDGKAAVENALKNIDAQAEGLSLSLIHILSPKARLTRQTLSVQSIKHINTLLIPNV